MTNAEWLALADNIDRNAGIGLSFILRGENAAIVTAALRAQPAEAGAIVERGSALPDVEIVSAAVHDAWMESRR